jgi:hypothetical protein
VQEKSFEEQTPGMKLQQKFANGGSRQVGEIRLKATNADSDE